MSIEEKKFKKYSKELQYQKSELEFVIEILKEAHLDFEEYYSQYCKDRSIDLQKLNKENKQKVDDLIPKPLSQNHDQYGNIITKKVSFEDNTHMKQFKKLYREAVKVCHPDIGGDESQFKRLAKAHDDKDWAALLDICDKNDIKPTEFHEMNKILKKQIEKIKNQIEREKSTYSWLLYQCEDNETCKHNVVKKFLKHLFNYGGYK